MYQKFYGFNDYPFNMTPNSKYFFKSAKHLEALSTMIYAIEQRKGFVVITGDVGSGKTTVCRTLLNKLGPMTQSALVTNTHISGRDLLRTILEEFDIQTVEDNKAHLLGKLNHYLIDQLRNDINVVLIIDEAQNLTPPVLEEVRMLSNLETECEKLIQIIFMGQPELKQKLALPHMEQLRQRIAAYYHLTPLTEEETTAYIRHRIKIASDGKSKIFMDEAIHLIYKFTKGVPRIINQICDGALLSGFIYEKQTIDPDLVKEVIREAPMAIITDAEKKKRLDFLEEFDRI